MKQIFKINKHTFFLLPQKAIYWEEMKMLIISDLHLGKSHHFRKSGVAVPKKGDYQNLKTLKGLIGVWNPSKILLLGDLFHSVANRHVLEVIEFIKQYKNIKMQLVIGNHDVMDDSWYKALNLEVYNELVIESFLFTHEPLDVTNIPTGLYNISGHIHPCVKLRGKARQSLRLPCFYFEEQKGIMPAFGKFTGSHKISPSKNSNVFVVIKNSVVAV